MNLLQVLTGRRRRTWAGRLAYVAVSAAAGLGLAVPAALATPGALTFAGCLGDPSGCTPVVAGALAGADALALTPDGRQLYAAATAGPAASAISHFTVDSSGKPTFVACYGSLPGCGLVSPGVLAGANALAVTPDGANLYVTSYNAPSVSHFTIDSSGNLTFAGCYGPAAGCTPVTPVNALHQPWGVAVTPDGQQLYVAAQHVVIHFTVGASGALTEDGVDADAPIGANAALAVTPDGAHLYVASGGTDSVSHFTIDPSGNLAFAGCIGDWGGCTPTTPAGALDGVDALAVVPGGTSLYVASSQGNSASRLAIDAAGNLGFAGCIGDLAGCATTSPPGVLDGASGVAVTSDGAHVYVTGAFAVSHFTVDAAANLIYAGCTGTGAGCTPVSPADAVNGVDAVAVTGDGSQLYATSWNGGTVSHFTIGGFTTATPPPFINRPRPCLFACTPPAMLPLPFPIHQLHG